MEPEESENAEIVFPYPQVGILDESYPTGQKIGITAEWVDHGAVPLCIECVHREVPATRIVRNF